MAELPDTGVRPRPDPAPPPGDAAVKPARLSAVSGLVFAGLVTAALVLVHRSPNLATSDADYAAFYGAGGRTVLVTVGTSLVPFAGIAFLWHLTATRLLVRARTPQPSAIPFGLQGLAGALLVTLLFAGTAAAGTVALVRDLTDAPLPGADVGRSLTGLGYALVFVYGTRAAGMYVITTTTLLRNAALLPRWAAVVGYLMATVMLLVTTFDPAVLLVLPAWVVLVAVLLLVRPAPEGRS